MNGKILSVFLILILPIILTSSTLLHTSTSESFYEGEIEKLGIEDEESEDIVDETIQFLKGQGQLTEDLVGIRAYFHMQDVKKYKSLLEYAIVSLIILFVLGLIVLFIIGKFNKVSNVLIYGSTLTLLNNLLLFLVARFTFQRAFTKFHETVFANDLWLLNPETDKLVAVFREQFFIDLIMRILTITSIAAIILLIIGIVWKLFSEKKPIKGKSFKHLKRRKFQWR
tara:strand:- start:2393 stop:3070 length:678 start_codon:yes stop_codon:yes gene_type:complete